MSHGSLTRVQAAELDSWREHVGSTKVQREIVDLNVLQRFAVATGADPDVEKTQPTLAHWALFLDAVTSERIGEDGHPARGGFLPAIRLPRRMFAAASIHFEGALIIGQVAECVATIAEVSHKQGRSGDLVFVEIDRVISQAQSVRVRERQTLVYRSAGEPLAPVVAKLHAADAGIVWQPGPVDLFRFSAVTFNAHRIHYDQQYARQIECYPDLVVHGPFAAIRLLSYARDMAQREVRSFAFKVVAPLFVSQPIYFVAGNEPGVVAAVRCNGVIAVTAKVEFQ